MSDLDNGPAQNWEFVFSDPEFSYRSCRKEHGQTDRRGRFRPVFVLFDAEICRNETKPLKLNHQKKTLKLAVILELVEAPSASLLVDECLRVKGTKPGEVLGSGDSGDANSMWILCLESFRQIFEFLYSFINLITKDGNWGLCNWRLCCERQASYSPGGIPTRLGCLDVACDSQFYSKCLKHQTVCWVCCRVLCMTISLKKTDFVRNSIC